MSCVIDMVAGELYGVLWESGDLDILIDEISKTSISSNAIDCLQTLYNLSDLFQDTPLAKKMVQRACLEIANMLREDCSPSEIYQLFLSTFQRSNILI